MTATASGQRRLITTLARSGVDFVLIGGHAVAAHGYERATQDVDVVFSTAFESCERFVVALEGLDASIVVADVPAPGGKPEANWLAAGGHFVFRTPHGQLDALSWIAGLDYGSLASRAETAELADGTRVRVCSFEDLVEMKRAGDRPRDREDLRELENLRNAPD